LFEFEHPARQLSLEVLALGDVVENGDRSLNLSGLVVDGRRPHLDVDAPVPLSDLHVVDG
jgi:hypothetical protein